MAHSSSYFEHLAGGNPGFGIEAVWTSIAKQVGVHRVLPDGRCDIILKYRASARPVKDVTVVVTGPTIMAYDVPLEPDMGFAGIRLRPGFFQPVLGFKPIILREKNLVGGAAISACPPLAELCADAASPDEFPDRLVDFVRCRIELKGASPSTQSLQVLGAIHASGGRMPVQDIGRMHGLSTRSVHRMVLDATGLPPKSYARILQFHRALRLLRDHRLSPSEAAVEAGYSDQSHMTHALRSLGSLSPAKLADVTLVTLAG